MSVLVACVLSFCTDLTGPHNFQLYDAQVKGNFLRVLNDLNIHGLSFIHQEVVFYVQLGIEKEISEIYTRRYRDVLRQLRLAGKEAEAKEKNPRNCLKTYREAAKRNITEFVHNLIPCVQPIHSEFINVTRETEHAAEDADILHQKLSNLEETAADCNYNGQCFETELNKFEREYDRIRVIHGDVMERRIRLLEKVPDVINCIRGHYQEIDDRLSAVLTEGAECIANL